MVPLLTIKDLTVTYLKSNVTALRDINLTFNGGQLVLIAGYNGSGKSTLAQTIVGIIPFFIKGRVKGDILVNGKSLFNLSRKELITTISYVPQYPYDYITSLLVEEEVAFPLENLGLPPKAIEKRLDEVFEKLNISHLRKRLITELSSGEIQRVELATALVTKAPILVLDEPLARIDPKTQILLLKYLRKLADEGKLILVFEHHLDQLNFIADKKVLLENGKISNKVYVSMSNFPFFEYNSIFSTKESGDYLKKDNNLLHMLKTFDDIASTKSKEALRLGDNKNGDDLIFSDVTFSYPKMSHNLFEDLNLTLKQGRILGLLGPNGVGKTTLIKLLICSLKPKKGAVMIGSNRLKSMKDSSQYITYIPENSKLFLMGPKAIDDLQKIIPNPGQLEEIINRYNIHDLVTKPIYYLSEGQRRLMALITAFQVNKEVLILDEPTIGLDIPTMEFFRELVKEYVKSGRTVIISSNDNRIYSLFDEVVVLLKEEDNKTKLIYGKPRDVLYSLDAENEIIVGSIIAKIKKLEQIHNCTLPHYLDPYELDTEVIEQLNKMVMSPINDEKLV